MSAELPTGYEVITGDCIAAMRDLADESVDAIVTDPPYGLGFMGKHWDQLPPGQDWADECLRVLKPGGHLLAFGGTRTYHRLACAIEDAGFEIRDQLQWLYGSGFPKSHNISKAIDKKAGAERPVIGSKPGVRGEEGSGWETRMPAKATGVKMVNCQVPITGPATPEAKQWDGWGTALKPANEPIVVARKPFKGPVAANVLAHGTGALNIDACRVGDNGGTAGAGAGAGGVYERAQLNGPRSTPVPGLGRWPANVILDEEAGELLDEQTAGRVGNGHWAKTKVTGYGEGIGNGTQEYSGPGPRDDSKAGASRFYYCAKAGKKERDVGLEDWNEKLFVQWQTGNGASGKASSMSADRNTQRRNIHPTVKPIALMAYLVRLVTPPGGLVLDPFLGSGTTGCAVAQENASERDPAYAFIGIEREAEYVEIAEARIAHWASETTAVT